MSRIRHSTAEPSQGPDFELREECESLLVDPDNLVGSDNLSDLPDPGTSLRHQPQPVTAPPVLLGQAGIITASADIILSNPITKREGIK